MFIILGILLLLIFFLIAYIGETAKNQVDIENPESVQLFVESCIRQATEDALAILGRHGSIAERDDFISDKVYVFSKSNYLKKDDFEQQIAGYVSQNLKECLSKPGDITLSSGSPAATIIIKNSSIITDVNYEVIIDTEERKAIYNKFSVELPLKLGMIADKVKNIFEAGIVLQDYNDIAISVEYAPTGKALITLFDKDNKVKGSAYYYRFGMNG